MGQVREQIVNVPDPIFYFGIDDVDSVNNIIDKDCQIYSQWNKIMFLDVNQVDSNINLCYNT